MAVALVTACSQNNAGSTLPAGAPAPAAARSATGTHSVAPQAKAMLSLIHGSNHAVVGMRAGVTKLFAPVEPDAATVLYNSIISNKNGKLADDISSLGFECCSTNEFGDALNLTANNARIQQVSFVLQSWACQIGSWNADNCLTNKGATFSEPITLKIYSVQPDTNGNPQANQVLVQDTKTFDVPYRPSADARCQGPNAGLFVGPVDKECDYGLSTKITFNVKVPKTFVPQQVIATLSYNTTHSGYQPYGENTTCYQSTGGCGYDSLNVSADGPGAQATGSVLDANGVQVYFTNPGFYCNGTGGNGSNALQDDTPCWTPYHPWIKVSGSGVTSM
ncbi:MAG TPA: hypothetical protein VGK84_00640 [Candidatus Tumulicola sp.]